MAKTDSTDTGANTQIEDDEPSSNPLNWVPEFFDADQYGEHGTMIHTAVALLDRSTKRAMGLSGIASILNADAVEQQDGQPLSHRLRGNLTIAMLALADDLADDLFNASFSMNQKRKKEQAQQKVGAQ